MFMKKTILMILMLCLVIGSASAFTVYNIVPEDNNVVNSQDTLFAFFLVRLLYDDINESVDCSLYLNPDELGYVKHSEDLNNTEGQIFASLPINVSAYQGEDDSAFYNYYVKCTNNVDQNYTSSIRGITFEPLFEYTSGDIAKATISGLGTAVISFSVYIGVIILVLIIVFGWKIAKKFL